MFMINHGHVKSLSLASAGNELQRNFADDGVRGYQLNSLFYRSIDIWNGLGADVVAATSVTSFKEKLLAEWEKDFHKL